MTTSPPLADVTRLARAVKRAQAALAQATDRRDRAMLTAQEAGATYPELAAASSVTRDRVNQILAEQRRKRAEQGQFPPAA